MKKTIEIKGQVYFTETENTNFCSIYFDFEEQTKAHKNREKEKQSEERKRKKNIKMNKKWNCIFKKC